MEDSVIRPNPLTDPIIPAIRSIALITAQSLGLFTALADEALGAESLAGKLGLNAVGVKRLAEVLRVCGYLSIDEEKYRLTEPSRVALMKGGSLQLTNWVEFCQVQIQAFGHLKTALSTGRPVDLFGLLEGEAGLSMHQRAMADTAKPIADWIAANTPVPPGAKEMLDVGGSHGLYSAAICRRNSPLRAEVMELPSVLETARRVSKEYCTDRYLSHIEGDVVTSKLTKTYDVVFLGNLIHHLTQQNARTTLSKTASATRRGGTIAIWDLSAAEQEPDETSACFSLLFYLTSGAKCYTELEIRELLGTCGYGQIRAIRPPGVSTHVLYTARTHI
jgi:hypothetical protein